MDLIGYRGTIKECHNLIVSELFGKTGTIMKTKVEDMSEWNSQCKAYHNTPQPNRVYYWLQFDTPITGGGNLKGWKGVWVEEVEREAVLRIHRDRYAMVKKWIR